MKSNILFSNLTNAVKEHDAISAILNAIEQYVDKTGDLDVELENLHKKYCRKQQLAFNKRMKLAVKFFNIRAK